LSGTGSRLNTANSANQSMKPIRIANRGIRPRSPQLEKWASYCAPSRSAPGRRPCAVSPPTLSIGHLPSSGFVLLLP
jgi:hypothetical protein